MTSVEVPAYLPLDTPRWRDVLVTAADVVHARTDDEARRAGLLVDRYGLTGRVYRHPHLSRHLSHLVEEIAR